MDSYDDEMDAIPITALNPQLDPLSAVPGSPGLLSEKAPENQSIPGDEAVGSDKNEPTSSKARKIGDGLSQQQSLGMRGSMSDYRAQVQMQFNPLRFIAHALLELKDSDR